MDYIGRIMNKDEVISVEEIDIKGERFIANHIATGFVVVTRQFLDAVEALDGVKIISIRGNNM